jgi:hypothetical protein
MSSQASPGGGPGRRAEAEPPTVPALRSWSRLSGGVAPVPGPDGRAVEVEGSSWGGWGADSLSGPLRAGIAPPGPSGWGSGRGRRGDMA